MELFNTVKDAANKNRSELALAAGIISYAGAIIVCRSRTLKAETILEKHRKIQVVTDVNDPERRTETDITTNTDILLAYAETYWPVLLLFGIGTFFCIGSHKDMLNKLSNALTIYSITNKAKQDYEAAAKTVLSPKKEEEIRHEVAERSIASDPVESAVIIETGHGHSLFRDYASGRYFYASQEWIDSCKAAFNDMLNDMATTGDGCLDLNDWYDMLGLPVIDLGKAWIFSQATGLLRIDKNWVPVDADRNCTVIYYSPITYANRDFLDY